MLSLSSYLSFISFIFVCKWNMKQIHNKRMLCQIHYFQEFIYLITFIIYNKQKYSVYKVLTRHSQCC